MAVFASPLPPAHLHEPDSPHQSFAESEHAPDLPADVWHELK
jgi:hypothetical protein